MVKILITMWRNWQINEDISTRLMKDNFDMYKKSIKKIEIIFESIPQLTLQVYIILLYHEKGDEITVRQIVSIITSILSIVIGLANTMELETFYYYRTTFEKSSLIQNSLQYLLRVLWYFLIVIPRIIIFSLLIPTILNPLIMVTSFVFLLIFICLNHVERKSISNQEQKRNSLLKELLFHSIDYFINVFYLNFGVYKTAKKTTKKENQTLEKHTILYFFYYVLFTLQNVGYLVLILYMKNTDFFQTFFSDFFPFVFTLIFFLISLIFLLILVVGICLSSIQILSTKIDNFFNNDKMNNIFYRLISRFLNNSVENSVDSIISKHLYKYDIYISGELSVDKLDNKSLIKYLDEKYDLAVCSSNQFEEDNERIVALLGAKLIIFSENKIQERHYKEFWTAKKLNVPILHVSNNLSDEKKLIGQLKSKYGHILEKKFKITNTIFSIIKQSTNCKPKEEEQQLSLPFTNIKNIHYLPENIVVKEFINLKFVGLINEEGQSNKTLLFLGLKCNTNSLEGGYYLYKTNIHTVHRYRKINFQNHFTISMDPEKKSIIIFGDSKITKYDINLKKKSESGKFDFEEINEIEVNEKNLFGMIRNSNQIISVNKDSKIIKKWIIEKPFKMKYLNKSLFILSGAYLEDFYSDSLETVSCDQHSKFDIVNIEDDTYSFRSFFFQSRVMKSISFLYNPVGLHVDENYIMIIGNYINKSRVVSEFIYLFLFNHKLKLLRKTNMEIKHEIFDFLIDSNKIYYIEKENNETCRLKVMDFEITGTQFSTNNFRTTTSENSISSYNEIESNF